MKNPAPRRQLNRSERLQAILERDGYECVWCRRVIEIGRQRATTEHIIPRVKGGPSWIENEVAACQGCNGARGHISPAEWIEECRRAGLEPNVNAISSALTALKQRVKTEGGNRRMRPYLAGQLRRLKT
jgi:5-methylcytosine-specific restriction endonuclease McrA